MRLRRRTEMATRWCVPWMAVAVLFLVGCANLLSLQMQADRLRPGMKVEEALATMTVPPKYRRQIDGLPEIVIYDYGTCAAVRDCEGPGLVFIDGLYYGKSLEIKTLLQPVYLASGTHRNEFGRYGVVPTKIITPKYAKTGSEAWVYEYEDEDGSWRQLIVYFKDDQLVNWIDLSVGSSKTRRGMREPAAKRLAMV